MFDDVIKFTNRESDLDKTSEYWESESYVERRRAIFTAIEEKTGFAPSKNMQPIREGVFKVKDATTIDDVVALSRKIKEWYTIDCFQAAIDRSDNTAHLLFDWNERESAKSVYINRSEQIALSVMILRDLDLPRPEGTELWLRHFLTGEYSDNPQVFNNILDRLKRAKLGKRNFRIARDVLTYVQQMCQGVVK